MTAPSLHGEVCNPSLFSELSLPYLAFKAIGQSQAGHSGYTMDQPTIIALSS